MGGAKRIFELAREIGVDSRAILERCRTEGIDVSSHLSSVSRGLAATIRGWFGAQANGHGTRNVMQLQDLAAQLKQQGKSLNGKPIEDAQDLVLLCKEIGLGDLIAGSEVDDDAQQKIWAALDGSGDSDLLTERPPEGGSDVQVPIRDSHSAAEEDWALGSNHNICLLGISKSGKTVFWASMIEHSLGRRSDETAAMLHGWRTDHPPVAKERIAASDICHRLLAGEVIERTLHDVYEAFSLTFKKRRDLLFSSAYTFQSHDLAGEHFHEWLEESEDAQKEIVARLSVDTKNAKALVILIDPTQGEHTLKWQDGLWRLLLDRLRAGRACYKKPVVLAFTKADDPSVAEDLGMPDRQTRDAARTDPVRYAEVTAEQDNVVRRFAERHVPKTWQAINRDEPQRLVRNATVMAISSTGVPVGPGIKVDALEPWRITDPFIWVLQALVPLRHRPPVSTAIRVTLLLLLLGVLAAVLGRGHWMRYRELVGIENRARVALHAKEFGVARQELSSAAGVHSWLYDDSRIANLRADIKRQEALAAVDALLSRNDFDGAFRYLVDNVPESARPEGRQRCIAALRAWRKENSRALLFSGTWIQRDYADVTRNAKVAIALCPDDAWAQDWARSSETRSFLCAVATLLNGEENTERTAATITDAQRAAVLVSDDALKKQLLRELGFQAHRLHVTLLSRMAAAYGSPTPDPDTLLSLAHEAKAIRSQAWCDDDTACLFWEMRISLYAFLLGGRPQEAASLYEAHRTDIMAMPATYRKQLADTAGLCERASSMSYVPAGRYQLGDKARTDSSPARLVSVPAFYIDRIEVTKSAFHRFISSSGYRPKDKDDWFLMDWRQAPLAPYDNELSDSVRYVNANDAIAYADYYGCDLPTEDEWEVAAGWDRRRGRLREYPYGDAFSEKATTISETDNPDGVSALGCRDMAGGLWEWVRAKEATAYVLKGGCGMDKDTLGKDRIRETTRVCFRRNMTGSERRMQFGFRCVLRPLSITQRKE